MHTYHLYGIRLKSNWPLPFAYPDETVSTRAAVELLEAPESLWREVSKEIGDAHGGDWFRQAHLGDGSSYLRWRGLFEFLITPEGHRILARRLEEGSWEAFATYLLGQVLSFALLQQDHGDQEQAGDDVQADDGVIGEGH